MRARRGRGHGRGLALMDFLVGTVILTAALTTYMAMTRAKFSLLDSGDLTLRALGAAEAQADQVHQDGLRVAPHGQAGPRGFRAVRTFAPGGRLPGAQGRVEARGLRMQKGDPRQLYEVRVTVSWHAPEGADHVSLSTVAVRAQGGGR